MKIFVLSNENINQRSINQLHKKSVGYPRNLGQILAKLWRKRLNL